MRRGMLVVALVVALFTAPAWGGAPADGGVDVAIHKCAADEAPAAAPVAVPVSAAAEAASVLPPDSGVDQALLERLHGVFRGLPGFVDVHFILEGPPRFVAWFDGPAPLVLPEAHAPYRVTAQRLDAVPLTQVTPAPSSASGAQGDADPPLVPTPCQGFRPGKGLLQGCTIAWMMSGSDGKQYAVSAGHCVSSVGQWVGYGWVRYLIAGGVGADFTVIELDPVYAAAHMSPSMCHWGGPTDTAGSVGFGRVAYQYGNGIALGTVFLTKPRVGVMYGFGTTSYTMVGPQINGDSGSPVRLESGPAIGVHTHGLGVIVFGTGLGFGTRLSHGVDRAEQALGLELSLLTAPEA